MIIKKALSLALALISIISLVACHPKVEPGTDMDRKLNCAQLQHEIQHVQDVRAKIIKARGLSVRNVGLMLIFWPGIVLNEITGESAETAANNKLVYLKNIYANQCSKECAEIAEADVAKTNAQT